MKTLCGRLPVSGADLASQPTISRLENQVKEADGKCLCRWFLERFLAAYSTPPEEIVLDVDGWDDPTHGCQQLTFFHGYYDQYMYYPVQISEARSGLSLAVHLRPGNSHAGKGVKAMLAWVNRGAGAGNRSIETSSPLPSSSRRSEANTSSASATFPRKAPSPHFLPLLPYSHDLDE